MAEPRQYKELARQLNAIGIVKRDLARVLPSDCPPASAVVLTVLDRYGEMRMSKLAELLAIDMSVTSRHVAHVEARGWIDRYPDPLDGRSRLLRLNPGGKALLDQVSERYTEALATCLADWSDDDVGRLSELLSRLRGAFGDCRARNCRTPASGAAPAGVTAPAQGTPVAGGAPPVGATAPAGGTPAAPPPPVRPHTPRTQYS
ncbi:winged helix-turn-helix transcriptional regulator [Streptomyces pactum]|uniref:Winged helix-turn-helix transcriptional regulator n=1 Tax=Streptomyces pactum TaxID=68249 RepID=A0ABS0NL07_9ACTN|nr:MarR family winged helix-turn-helix transcriptional regulator [Streptomyces pactum]MBH5335836.1 winged helix-turn-helix transcriptional regulator [Streptomyces pactum]